MIYKPLRAAIWPPVEKGLVTVPTTIIDNMAMLQEADLRSAPGIFQKKIDKVAEVRATFMGRSVFAWEKQFEGRTEQLDIDWRMMNRGAKHAKHVLPSGIQGRCRPSGRSPSLSSGHSPTESAAPDKPDVGHDCRLAVWRRHWTVLRIAGHKIALSVVFEKYDALARS